MVKVVNDDAEWTIDCRRDVLRERLCLVTARRGSPPVSSTRMRGHLTFTLS
jgi:hypothetical protein